MQSINWISTVLSILNISTIIWKLYLDRSKLKFFIEDKQYSNIFIKYGFDEFIDFDGSKIIYQDSSGIIFYYIKIANLSNKPCTIMNFTLSVEGYNDSFYRCNTKIAGNYKFSTGINSSIKIFEENILKLPCTIPPFGYSEGYLVFPYNDLYQEEKFYANIVVNTTRKKFFTGDFICRKNTI